jgi:hypothetical protein
MFLEQTTPDDRPLDTETAAPPAVPPRRPIVGAAITADLDGRAGRRSQDDRPVRLSYNDMPRCHASAHARTRDDITCPR